MKKVLTILVFLIIAACGDNSNSVEQKNNYTNDDWEKYSMDIQNTFNAKCPMMIDKETRLDNIVCLDKSVAYNFTLVNTLKSNLTDEDILDFKTKQAKLMNNLVKTNPNMSYIKQFNLRLDYLYSDNQKNFITMVSTSPNEYNN